MEWYRFEIMLALQMAVKGTIPVAVLWLPLAFLPVVFFFVGLGFDFILVAVSL